MLKRLTVLIFVLVVFSIVEARTISGVISDKKTNNAIKGATVVFKGTKAVTDDNGKFSLSTTVTAQDSILVYKYRYQFKSELLPGAATTYDAALDSAVFSRTFAPPLRTVGGMIYNAKNQPVCLQGVAIHEAYNLRESDFINWTKNWKINFVRLVFHSHDVHDWTSYLNNVDKVLKWTIQYEVYVVIDGFHEAGFTGDLNFHWNKVQEVWKILMPRLKNYNHVLWEIYNEPYGSGGDKWEIWVPKAKILVDLIRSYNPVVTTCIVPGVFWAQFIELDKATLDREQIIYSFHPYFGTFWNAPHTPASWDKYFGHLAKDDEGPVFCGEWAAKDKGSDTGNQVNTYFKPILKYFDDNAINFTHWGYFPSWGGAANLVSNSLGQPEKRTYWGDLLYEYFQLKWKQYIAPAVPRTVPDRKNSPFDIIQNRNRLVIHTPAGPGAQRIAIYNVNGKLVDTYGAGGGAQSTIRTNAMTNGCYVVKSTGDRSHAQKVILNGKK